MEIFNDLTYSQEEMAAIKGKDNSENKASTKVYAHILYPIKTKYID